MAFVAMMLPAYGGEGARHFSAIWLVGSGIRFPRGFAGFLKKWRLGRGILSRQQSCRNAAIWRRRRAAETQRAKDPLVDLRDHSQT